jgi:hypothetical protein
VIDFRTVLRTILIAGTLIQDEVDGTGEGDTIYVHAGMNAGECG